MQHQYKAPHCGRTIKVTNVGGGPDATVEGKGNSVTVRLVDSCDACHNNHIDLSSEAWRLMTNGHVRSKVNVEWCVVFPGNHIQRGANGCSGDSSRDASHVVLCVMSLGRRCVFLRAGAIL